MSAPAPDQSPKASLRRLYRSRRKTEVARFSPAEREVQERALAAIAAPLLKLAAPVASYAAMRDEIDPRWIAPVSGPHALPRITDYGLMFHLSAWEDMVPGAMGIPEPPASAPIVTPRLLLVPLLAATLAGTRLGQGGGYYDRTLKALRAHDNIVAVGIAWDVQIADFLPHDPWDEQLDWIATPTRLVECAANR